LQDGKGNSIRRLIPSGPSRREDRLFPVILVYFADLNYF